jgi:hypothetical protein
MSSSRFSVLLDDNCKKEVIKNYKSVTNKSVTNENDKEFSSFRPLDEKEKERRKLKREADIIHQREQKERTRQESLSINNFPELVINHNNHYSTSCYIDKLKVMNTFEEEKAELETGWVYYNRDLSSNMIIKKMVIETNEKDDFKIDSVDFDFNVFSNLYENRTNEYIEYYGYDEWEKMFKFPNWREEEKYLEMKEAEMYEYSMDDSDNSCDDNELV